MGCTFSRYSRTCGGSSPSTSVSPVAAAELPNPNLDVTLAPINGDARPLREWLTTFHLASFVLDPYTNESSWILETAARIMRQYKGAAVRVNFLIACGAEDAKTFLGPLADDL